MSGYVGRISWRAQERGSGQTQSGLRWIGVDDVRIERREITWGESRLAERMKEFAADRYPTPEEIERIVNEIGLAPDAGEPAEVWYSKSIQLSDSYRFEYAEFPKRGLMVGFGFAADLGQANGDSHSPGTFSWEWFNVEAPGEAGKLQESGRLRYRQQETALGSEIVHMVFETDVSLRIYRESSLATEKPDWRIDILRGSEIYWPSLVQGENRPNGFLSESAQD